jgi:Flp pilus assembly secretin CpaC
MGRPLDAGDAGGHNAQNGNRPGRMARRAKECSMPFDLGRLQRRLAVATIVSLGTAAFSGFAFAEETIDVTIDFARVMRIDQPAHTIVVGNPGIADAAIGDERTLVLTGKTAGTTNLIVLDDAGEEILNAILRVSSDVRQLTTVFYGSQRQTFSCAPVCEQVISVGDDPTSFENATAQIQTRQEFSTGR